MFFAKTRGTSVLRRPQTPILACSGVEPPIDWSRPISMGISRRTLRCGEPMERLLFSIYSNRPPELSALNNLPATTTIQVWSGIGMVMAKLIWRSIVTAHSPAIKVSSLSGGPPMGRSQFSGECRATSHYAGISTVTAKWMLRSIEPRTTSGISCKAQMASPVMFIPADRRTNASAAILTAMAKQTSLFTRTALGRYCKAQITKACTPGGG